jgi:hypothetical protein
MIEGLKHSKKFETNKKFIKNIKPA